MWQLPSVAPSSCRPRKSAQASVDALKAGLEKKMPVKRSHGSHGGAVVMEVGWVDRGNGTRVVGTRVIVKF